MKDDLNPLKNPKIKLQLKGLLWAGLAFGVPLLAIWWAISLVQ